MISHRGTETVKIEIVEKKTKLIFSDMLFPKIFIRIRFLLMLYTPKNGSSKFHCANFS
jgi:hypothetical protein